LLPIIVEAHLGSDLTQKEVHKMIQNIEGDTLFQEDMRKGGLIIHDYIFNKNGPPIHHLIDVFEQLYNITNQKREFAELTEEIKSWFRLVTDLAIQSVRLCYHHEGIQIHAMLIVAFS
jgi:hypothetical protein